MSRVEKVIFRNGSATYYWSSLFFPRHMRDDVFNLYSFVRLADDYVDSTPAQKQQFLALRTAYEQAIADDSFDAKPSVHDTTDERVIKNIVSLSRKYDFDPSWVTSFLNSMQSDIEGKCYATMDELSDYMYGSAEVVGLMMVRIFGVAEAAQDSARKLGRAMQYINFIRDISEDVERGRCYFPKDTLDRFGLPDLSPKTIKKYPAKYKTFIYAQIEQYRLWQEEAERGFGYLPLTVRAPVRTASDMYRWSAVNIAKDPVGAYVYRVKPGRARVLCRGVWNLVSRS